MITDHARLRMQTRNITTDDIETAMRYGRQLFTNKAILIFVGKQELNRHEHLDQSLDGLLIVMSKDYRSVVTCYRDRGLRTKRFPNKPHFRRFKRPRHRRSWFEYR